jgi:hypothetical protein
LSYGEQKNQENQKKNRKNRTIKKQFKPIKILKKSTSLIRFHKPETEKLNRIEPKPKKNRAKQKKRAKPKKSSQIEKKQFCSKITEPNRNRSV